MWGSFKLLPLLYGETNIFKCGDWKKVQLNNNNNITNKKETIMV